jgi:hypothetical protein
VSGPAREQRPQRHGPATAPLRKQAPAKNSSQAKARAKARKAKAPKIARVPIRQRVLIRLTRLSEIDLSPRRLAARVPFVVLVIGALGLGLGVTLWLSTDAAERSYRLGHARLVNQGLLQQKEALERQVLEAQAAPALAEAARGLGMIPSRDTAHLVQDPAGNWIVVGTPKPAEGVPPPPLNVQLPDPVPPPAATPTPAPPAPVRGERPVLLPGMPVPAGVAAPEVLVRTPSPGAVPAPAPAPAAPLAVPAPAPAPVDIPALGAIPVIPVVPVVPPADPAPVDPAPAPAVPGAPA